jgi:hypothetical protein
MRALPSRGLFRGEAVAVPASMLPETISDTAPTVIFDSVLPGRGSQRVAKDLMPLHYVSELVLCSVAAMIEDRNAHYNNGCLYAGCTHKEPSLYPLFDMDSGRHEYILMRKSIC